VTFMQVMNIEIGHVIVVIIAKGRCGIHASHKDCGWLCHFYDNTTG
jgi:hypothetical protein